MIRHPLLSQPHLQIISCVVGNCGREHASIGEWQNCIACRTGVVSKYERPQPLSFMHAEELQMDPLKESLWDGDTCRFVCGLVLGLAIGCVIGWSAVQIMRLFGFPSP